LRRLSSVTGNRSAEAPPHTDSPEDIMNVKRTVTAAVATIALAAGIIGITAAPAAAQPKERVGDCAKLIGDMQLYELKDTLWEGLAQMYAAENDTAGFNDAIDEATFWAVAATAAENAVARAGC
jgi:hypothetical protein